MSRAYRVECPRCSRALLTVEEDPGDALLGVAWSGAQAARHAETDNGTVTVACRCHPTPVLRLRPETLRRPFTRPDLWERVRVPRLSVAEMG